MFLTDGLAGGRYLGRGLARYLPMSGLNLGRLSIGVGASGAVMAALNYGVARFFSTDVWLVYSTFGDTILAIGLVLAAVEYARRGPAPAARAAA
jgi:intracellular septation protein A